jgi:tetratricopeptide (TPR) repeat protein
MPSLRPLLAPMLLTLLIARSAAADQTSSPEAAPEVGEAEKKEAGRRFGHAIKLYEDGDYTLALAEFERVYELMPNYRVLYNIGQVSIQLGRYARAFRTLKEYVARGGAELPSDRVKSVQADLELLAGRIATVTVLVDQPGAQISLDGTVLGTSPLAEPLIVDVGEHILQVRLPGYSTQTQRLTLAGGDRRESSFVLETERSGPAVTPAPPIATAPTAPARSATPRKPHASRTWIGWTTTGALTAGAIVSGALGASAVSDLKKLKNTEGATRPELDQAQRRAETRLLVADLLTAAAVVSGGVTLYFQLSGSGSEGRASARPQPLRLLVTASNVSLIFQQ